MSGRNSPCPQFEELQMECDLKTEADFQTSCKSKVGREMEKEKNKTKMFKGNKLSAKYLDTVY